MSERIVTVFRSRLRPENEHQYDVMGDRMDELARSMPGFVEVKGFTADDGERLTLVTFADAESQRAWREHPEHRIAQRRGREAFYSEYSIVVAQETYASQFSQG